MTAAIRARLLAWAVATSLAALALPAAAAAAWTAAGTFQTAGDAVSMDEGGVSGVTTHGTVLNVVDVCHRAANGLCPAASAELQFRAKAPGDADFRLEHSVAIGYVIGGPAMTFGPDGSATVAYRTADMHVGVVRRAPDGTWTSVADLPGDGFDSDAVVESDAQGNTLVLVAGRLGTRVTTISATGDVATATLPFTLPDGANDRIDDVVLGVSPDGHAVAAMTRTGYDTSVGTTFFSAVYERSGPDGAWSLVDSWDRNGGRDVYGAAIDDDGDLAVLRLMAVGHGSTPELLVRSGSDGALATEPSPLAYAGNGAALHLAADGALSFDGWDDDRHPMTADRAAGASAWELHEMPSTTDGQWAVNAAGQRAAAATASVIDEFVTRTWAAVRQAPGTDWPVATMLEEQPSATSPNAGRLTIDPDGIAAFAVPRFDVCRDSVDDDTPCVVTVYVSDSAANALITAGPSGTVAGREHTFSFSSDQPASAFECRLDDAAWAACTSPHTLSSLADGEHTFAVRADEGAAAEQAFTVDATPPATTIASGPDGETTDTTVAFAFSASEDDATFECALDGAAWSSCASPRTYAGVALGVHTFRARATDAVGNVDVTGATRTFAVVSEAGGGDDGGGGDNGGGDNGGAGDGGGTTGGGHGGGGQSGGGSGGGQSGGGNGGGSGGGDVCTFDGASLARASAVAHAAACGGPQPVACAAGRVDGIQAGNAVAVAATRAGCFTHLRSGEYVSAGPVRLNGLDLRLPAGGKLVVDPRHFHVWTTTAGTLTFGRLGLPIHKLNWKGTGGVSSKQVVPVGKHLIGPLLVRGNIAVTITDDEGGRAELTFGDVGLPDRFGVRPHRNGDKIKTGEVSAGFQTSTSNERGLRAGATLKVAETYLFGRVHAHDVIVTVDIGSDWTISGQATIEIPALKRRSASPEAVVALTVKPSSDVTGWRFAVSLAVQRINKPLGDGFFLQKLGGAYDQGVGGDPFLAGTLGISFGPEFTLGAEHVPGLFSVEGTGKIAWPSGGGLKLSAEGTGRLVNQEISKGSVSWDLLNGETEFSGKLSLAYGGYGFFYTVPKTTITQDEMAVYGYGQLRLPGFGGAWEQDAQILVARVGAAGCAGPRGKRTGFGYEWGGRLEKFAGTCDVDRWKAAHHASASAAGDRTVAIARGLPLAVLAVRGEGAPPKVTLTGPDGTRVVTPADARGVSNEDALLVQDPSDDTTYITLYAPAAGTWTVAAQAGSVPVAGLRSADGLPAPKVRGHLTRGGRGGPARKRRGHLTHKRDGRMVLHYAVTRRRGQVVRLFERGRGVLRRLARNARGHGRLRFRPAAGPGGRREIVAQVLQNGLPRATVRLASFRAPARSRQLARPRRLAVARRAHARLAVRFRRVARAVGYTVTVKAGAGPNRTYHLRRRTRRIVAHVPKRARATVTVVALGPRGEISAPTVRQLRAPRRR